MLITMQAGFLQNSPVTLTANQSTFGTANAINSASVTYPGGTWPTGTGFQINFVAKNSADAAIYAQSLMFTISNTGSASSASSPTTLMVTSGSSTSATPVMTVVSASGSGSGNSGDASGGIPNSVRPAAYREEYRILTRLVHHIQVGWRDRRHPLGAGLSAHWRRWSPRPHGIGTSMLL